MRLPVLCALSAALLAASSRPHPPRADCSVQLEMFPAQLSDLDGDGQKEHDLKLDCGATGNCTRLLVVSNGDRCPRLVGEFWGETPVRLETRSNGLRDVAVFYDSGCAGMEGSLVRYRFNGENYAAAETIACTCEGESDSRCRTWRPP